MKGVSLMPDSVTNDIKQALLAMLGERDIRRVTMKDIAGRAHVSRGHCTFITKINMRF